MTDPNHPDFDRLTDATRRLENVLSLPSVASVLPSATHTQHVHPSTARMTPEMENDTIRQDDFYSCYTASEKASLEISGYDTRFDGFGSSLVLDEYEDKDSGNDDQQPSTATDNDDLSNIQPRIVKVLDTRSVTPNVASTTESIDSSANKGVPAQVQMTFIQPATAKVQKLDQSAQDMDTNTSGPIESINTAASSSATEIHLPTKQTHTKAPLVTATVAAVTPTPYVTPTPAPVIAATSSGLPDTVHTSSAVSPRPRQQTLSPATSEPPRPISPRAVQVQQAVTPVAAMKAVPEKTNDYFSKFSTGNPGTPTLTNMDRSSGTDSCVTESFTSSSPVNTVLPRTSSIKEGAQAVNPLNQSMQQNTAISKSLTNVQSPVLSRNDTPGSPQKVSNQPAQQSLPSNAPHSGYQAANLQTPLVRTSSHNSTTQQLARANPSPHPPRTHSNRQHSLSNNQIGAPTQVNQQPSSPGLQKQGIARSPMQSPTPSSMDDQQNAVRQVVYSNNQCEVFHWKAQSWYAVEDQCTLQVRLTFGGRSCLAIQLQTSGQMYLNAWIVPSMAVSQPSPTDISISVTMVSQQENYLVHFHHPADASNLLAMLHRMHHESFSQPQVSPLPPPVSVNHHQQQVRSNRTQTTAVELRDETPSVEDVPQTLKPVFQCKCKLFVQSETSKWNPLGSTAMRISQQLPSQKIHVYIEDDKHKLISSIVRSGNVERLTNKRITFLLTDDKDKTSTVHLIQLKDEATGNKVFDYLKTQNAAQGW